MDRVFFHTQFVVLSFIGIIVGSIGMTNNLNNINNEQTIDHFVGVTNMV